MESRRQGYCQLTGVRRAQRMLLRNCASTEDGKTKRLRRSNTTRCGKRGERSVGQELALGGRALTAERRVQLRARGDLEFGEDLVEVEPDRARRQVEPLANLAVGSPLSSLDSIVIAPTSACTNYLAIGALA